jgi:cobalt-zinc-cadmium resistance protein CzcA
MSLSADKASVGTSFNIPKSEIGFSYGNVSSAAVDNSLSFSQSFLFPSVYFNQLKLSKAKALAGEYRLKDAQLQLSAKVKRLYWKIVYCKALNSLLISEDSLLSSVVIATQSRVSSGDAASLDLMSARSLQMETKNKQKKNEVDIDILTDEFKSLLNISFPFLLNDSVLVPLPFDSLPTDSLIHNPLWALSSQQTKISEYERLVVRSKIYPDISVGFTSQTYKDLKDFSIGRRFYSVQLGLSFPLFCGGFVADNKVAKARVRQAEAFAYDSQRSLGASYHSQLAECIRLYNSLLYYQQFAVPNANAIIQQSRFAYEQGDISYADYLLNVTRTLQIKQASLESIDLFNQAVILFDTILGKIY